VEKEATTTLERAEKERAREAKEETMTMACVETIATDFRHHNSVGPTV
jgi:hypothetical protein